MSQPGAARRPGPRSAMRILAPYFRQVSGLLVIGSVCGIVMNTAIVLPAILLGHAIDVVDGLERHQLTEAALIWAILALVGGTAATELPRIGKRYWLGVARTRIRANVRSDAFRGSLASPSDIPVGDLMARIVGDVDVLSTGLNEIIVETWDTVLFSISLIWAMFAYDLRLTLLTLSPVPLALLLGLVAGRMVAARTTRARESAAELTVSLHEQIGGLRLLRLYGRAKAATATVAHLARRQATAELRAIWLDELLGALYGGLLVAGIFFVLAVGSADVVSGRLTIGGFVAFLQLFMRFTKRAPRLPQMVNRVQAGGAALARLVPLLAVPPPRFNEPRWSTFRSALVTGASTAVPIATAAGPRRAAQLEFRDVSFMYPGSDRPALAAIDLLVPAGSLVAVTGAVGAGKSALAQLAAGMFAPSAGSVLIDGRPVATLKPNERIGLIGYVSEEPRLFSGRIADNIGFWGRVAHDPLVAHAADIAALGPDLSLMPVGLDTEIGELGVRVSGGQRLRIALARAIAAAGEVPSVLILDDPFSAVDVETEATIIRSMRESFGPAAPESQRVTVLLCSHRLAAFPQADLVVVLQSGRIAERGTHSALLAGDGLYARIFRAQATLAGLAS